MRAVGGSCCDRFREKVKENCSGVNDRGAAAADRFVRRAVGVRLLSLLNVG
jgi:hypothetical protein